MRQLWDFNQGSRRSPAMAPIAAKLGLNDMTNIAAYVASLAP
jgi:cytochrome c553